MIEEEIFIIESAQGGSEDAWRRLFGLHFQGVYRYCLHLAGGRNGLAEDLAQQVFVIAARKINRFDPHRSTFRLWLFGIARNGFKKILTKESKHPTQEPPADTGFEPDDTQLTVHEILAQLPAHYCSVLEAKYLHGLSVNEIAERHGYTVKAAESLLTRAREKFAAAYKQACR